MGNKWGIIGTGMIAKVLARALKECPEADLAAVGSRDQAKAEAFAAEFGAARAYGSYEALLADPEVVFVYNSLPNSLHHEWTIKAARGGKHILCEKPLSVTVAEAEAMYAAAGEAGVVLMEAFMYRCHPQIVRIKEIVASGEIGELRVIRSRFSYGMNDLTNVRFSKPLHGGALMDVGCYCTSFSRLIAGAEPVQVSGEARWGPVSEVDEVFVGTLRFADGTLAQFDAGMICAGATNADIMGSKGHIEVPQPWKPGAESRLVVRVGRESREERIAGANPYALEIRNIQAVVNEGAAPIISEGETIGNMRTICGLLEAARTAAVVQL